MKRRATLDLYADYIEQFYISRSEDADTVTIDTSSIESIMASVPHILGSLLPAIHEASPEKDIFSLGLNSLLVLRAVKSIRAAMGLQDQLAPRHLYANPTIAKFSATLARMAAEAKKLKGTVSDDYIDKDLGKMKGMIEKHKAHLSFKLNPFDYVNPNHYMGLNFFLALQEDASFEQAFDNLQKGLHRTMQLIPALDGKMMACSEHEIAYTKGDLRLTIPPHPSSILSHSDDTDSFMPPRQLLCRIYLRFFHHLRNYEMPVSALRDQGRTHPPREYISAAAR